MRRVARRRKAREAENAVAHEVHVAARHRSELAPERVEGVSVEPACAALESLGLDQMRCSDLGDVHLQLGMLAHQHAGGARMIEMNVTQQEMPHVRKLHALLLEAVLQRGDRRRRSAVEQRGAVIGVEQVAPDRALAARVVKVDRIHATRSRDAARISAASSRLPQPRVSVFFDGSRSL